MSNDQSSASPRASRPTPDGWEETRAQTALATQFAPDADGYLAAETQDVGRLTGADVHELFVSCDPAEALQQQFEHLQPGFIAVHDIGTAASRKLLSGVAAATGRKLQRLVIRRQGYGTVLASLEFVELPTAQGRLLRMYSTEADADTAVRHALAHTLLGHSRLGVVMVGDLPPHTVAPALRPLRDRIAAGPWPNRQLLLLPLAAASTLGAHAADLGQAQGVSVQTTPQVTRPADAWSFISAGWSRLDDRAPVGVTPATTRAVRDLPRAIAAGFAPTRPVDLRPMPSVPSAPQRAAAAPPVDVLERYLLQLAGLTGMVSCCLFDVATGRDVAPAGTSPTATQLALHGTQLLAAMGVASRTLGFGQALPDAAITFGSHHLLLRGVPRHPGLALHAVLDKTQANLMLARLQIQRLDALFGDVPTA